MATFLRLELASRDGETVLVNVDAIVRIHPTWPQGCTVVLSDDTSLHVRATLAQIDVRLRTTGGRIGVFPVEAPYELEQEIDAAYEAARADLLP
jgi:hypothetical protein